MAVWARRLGGGEALALAALLKMRLGAQVINDDGIGSAIKLASGTLGPAFPLSAAACGLPPASAHRGPITGRHLGAWPAAKHLARRAHLLFPDFITLGCDIALAPAGPVLLETNACWDVTLPQIALQRLLADTAYGARSASKSRAVAPRGADDRSRQHGREAGGACAANPPRQRWLAFTGFPGREAPASRFRAMKLQLQGSSATATGS